MSTYLDGLSRCLRRSDQRRSFSWYITSLLLDGERKSIEPMAGRLAEKLEEQDATRQRIQQIVSVAPWAEAHLFEALP